MLLLLQGRIRPEQEGAFLMLLRVREETAQEIAGFTQACRQTTEPAFAKLRVDLDVSAYAGKRRQLPWFLLALAVLAQSGVRILLHGTQEPHSKRLYAREVLAKLGVAPVIGASEAASALGEYRFCYADLSTLHPRLDRLIQLREVFGLRSCANTLARLLNPSNAPFSLQGVHHRHVDVRHMHVSEQLLDANSMCFRGEGGEPEQNPSAETQLCMSRAGKSEVINIPSSQRWEMKDTRLDVAQMQGLFSGAQMHFYGESAAICTLRNMLILLEQQSVESAQKLAQSMWDNRDKRYLFVK
jgi:anthranilate phosphoribosyltransferase